MRHRKTAARLLATVLLCVATTRKPRPLPTYVLLLPGDTVTPYPEFPNYGAGLPAVGNPFDRECGCCGNEKHGVHVGRTWDSPLAKELATLVCAVCDQPAADLELQNDPRSDDLEGT